MKLGPHLYRRRIKAEFAQTVSFYFQVGIAALEANQRTTQLLAIFLLIVGCLLGALTGWHWILVTVNFVRGYTIVSPTLNVWFVSFRQDTPLTAGAVLTLTVTLTTDSRTW